MRRVVVVMMFCAVAAAGARIAAAGGAGPLQAGDPSDAAVAALVTEVRALRAELNDAARRSFSAQLLLARLQMQEARLAHLDRQRAEVLTRLNDQSDVVGAIAERVQEMAGNCHAVPDPKACQAHLGQQERELAAQRGVEQRLRAQDTDLFTALSVEQARWADLNARLDELERSASPR